MSYFTQLSALYAAIRARKWSIAYGLADGLEAMLRERR